MTECADAVFWRGRIAGLEDPPRVLDRVVLGRAVKFGVRAIGGKGRTTTDFGSPDAAT